jgi:outer membrane protein assembly factor BamD
LENVLEDFPSTKLRPKIYDYIMKSRYELALKSIYTLKKSVLKVPLLIQDSRKELPNTEYSKTALILEENWKRKKHFAVVKKNRSKIAALTQNRKKAEKLAARIKQNSRSKIRSVTKSRQSRCRGTVQHLRPLLRQRLSKLKDNS